MPDAPDEHLTNDHRDGQRPEVRLADIILQVDDEVSRAKIATFLRFAPDPSKITINLDCPRETGMRLAILYPYAKDD